MKKAILTIAIGNGHRAIAQLTYPFMLKYAKKVDAELIVISKQDHSSPYFDKFKIYDLLDSYERILYLDIDVLVNESCPDIFQWVPERALGIYDEGLPATEEERSVHEQVMRKASGAYGIELSSRGNRFYNAGVMAVSRAQRELFKKPEKEIQMEYGEQPLLNLRVFRSETEVFEIGYEFNRMPYVEERVKKSRLECHLIHYAGLPNAYELIREDIRKSSLSKEHALLTPHTRQEMLDRIEIEGKKCVEVGVADGYFSQDILARNPAELWLVDPWTTQPLHVYPDDWSNADQENFERMYYGVLERFEKDRRVHIIRDFSLHAAPLFKGESLDFVYVDAIHAFESCFCDMVTWFPKIKNGGWLCGHDYTGKYLGVREAVTRFANLSGQKLSLLCMEQYASWGIRKRI